MSQDAGQPESGDRGFGRPVVFAVVPVMVLAVVFAVQFVAANTTELSQWKGGGFGMFTDIDSGVNRIAHLYLEFDGDSYPVEIPTAFDEQIQSLMPMPNQERTEAMASAFLESNWVEVSTSPPALIGLGHQANPAVDRHWVLKEPLHDDDRVVRPDAVRLKVWKRTFHGDKDGGGQLGRELLQDVRVSRGDRK